MGTEQQLRENLAELQSRLCEQARLLGFAAGKELRGCSRGCAHKALLKRLLAESIVEFERTRSSFKSRQIEQLRAKFTVLLSQMD